MNDVMEFPDGATPLDPEELAGLKHKYVTTRSQLDELEQANIQEGIRWLKNRRNRSDILNERFVREFHRRLFGDIWIWAGDFRTTEKNIGVAPHQIAPQLRDLLADAKHWIENQTYDAIEIAARLHHRLVKIHAFSNGNGRHARIFVDIVSTELLKVGELDWTRGHDLQKMNDRRSEYINALRAADANNYVPLLNFLQQE